MQDFKKLEIWKRSYFFAIKIYKATKFFPKEELYALTNQMQRAAVSIPANIAEGCGKNTNNDYAKFLDIASGSSCELETYIDLSRDLNYLKEDLYADLLKEIKEIKAMLTSYIYTIRT